MINAASPQSPLPLQQRSPWHSPVPYLFGGLAAMLGLIAFALLILACSYWKLSGYLDGENGDDRESGGDLESGKSDGVNKQPYEYEEKILVIMAGDVKPTFLATPATSRNSSFGDRSSCSTSYRKCEKLDEEVESIETIRQVNLDDNNSGSSGGGDQLSNRRS